MLTFPFLKRLGSQAKVDKASEATNIPSITKLKLAPKPF
jgi:hypothetical protein